MTVYKGDKPAWLQTAIDSIASQTIPPFEFVIVVDGPISDSLDEVLRRYMTQSHIFHVIRLKENHGLAFALNVGLRNCRCPIIMRMDADDYSLPSRYEKQIEVMLSRNLDFIGSNVEEFEGSLDNVISKAVMPVYSDELIRMAKKRNPIRHPSLVIKKSALEAVGAYDAKLLNGQDYDLIVRLLMAGFQGGNINETLVKMRVSPEFYSRRGGWKYFVRMRALKRKLYKIGFYNKWDYFVGVTAHFVSSMIPQKIRKVIYLKLLRS